MADSLGQGGEVQSQWVRVRARLRAEHGDAAYRSWLRNMSLQGIEEGRAKIAVPTRFLRDWVAAHYADRIRALWNGENNGVIAVDILVSGGTPQVVATAEPAPELSAEASAETVD
jgi:chromosomal replication initiator protein